jgi:hypothetical protein
MASAVRADRDTEAGYRRAEVDDRSAAASLQGGLLLTQTMQSSKPLEAALDAALTSLRAAASAASFSLGD